MRERRYGKDEIIQSAAEIFEKSGVSVDNLDKISEKIHVSELSIKNEYSTFEELEDDVLEYETSRLVKMVTDLEQSMKYYDKSGAEQISTIIKEYMKVFFEHYESVRVIKDIVGKYRDGDLKFITIFEQYSNDLNAMIKKAIEKSVQEFVDSNATNIYDPLTGLYTKTAFIEKVREELDANPDGRYEIVATDIEKFKILNDKYGIQEGDKLLRYMGNRIRKLTAAEGGIATRANADIYYVLIKHEDGKIADIVGNALEDIKMDYASISVVLKFGVYRITDKSLPIEFMCDRAQLAASSIKGKYNVSCAYYDDSLRKSLLTEQLITSEMENALKEEQFEVYFQPKYDLISEKMAGAEALVRWNHPKKGFISPGDFIPVFERNGFITKMDMFVWEKTCGYLAQWKSKYGNIVPISVNVSRHDLYVERIADIIEGMVEKYGLETKDLHLEITESAYTDDSEKILEVVGEFKRRGFKIEMDDFGSGYSSLNMLSDMPVDILKMDMRFVQTKDLSNSRNVMNFVTGLAKWMNLLVVAEGVETQEQVNVLKALECNYVQGFFFSRPLPADAFEEYHKENAVTQSSGLKILNDPNGELYISKGGSDKVLIMVDSMLWNCNLITEYFKDKYTVVYTENALVAWDFIRDNYDNIQAAIVDLNVEGMSGMEFIVNMRKNKLTGMIPIIATSQFGHGGEEMALTLGASDFVQKPYGRGVIIRRVQNMLMNKNQNMDDFNGVDKASIDPGTGFYNQQGIRSQIFAFNKLDRIKRGVFMVIDIDDFMSISNSRGYHTGSLIIKNIVGVLKNSFRKDELISHSGGDEFCVFLPEDMTDEGLKNRMDKLIDDLKFELDDEVVTCSVGICIYNDKCNTYEDLYREGKNALEEAKKQGKNRFYISEIKN